jgi:putative ABC transport system permease protein
MTSPAAQPHVQRQIVLPTSKAVEIAYKSIRLRLSRSLLVTSGIVLALAFLMSILATDAITSGMRGWIEQQRGATAPLRELPADDPARRAAQERLTEASRLEERMKSGGVPTTPAEIQNNKIQTRWLLGLALLVAFVGILNAMLMSVTERFREIGTMKCLGALDSFIIKLFLIESLFQGIVGTIIGVAVGVILSIAGASSTYGEFAWKNFPVAQILASVGICLMIGIGLTVAGAVYPAWQAARMQPIEAMRVET